MRNTVDTKDKAILAELTKIAEDYFNTLEIEEGAYSSVDLCRMDFARYRDEADCTVTVGTYSCKFARGMVFELVNRFEKICGISGAKRHKFIKLAADGLEVETVDVNKMEREHVKVETDWDMVEDVIRRHSYKNSGLAYDVSTSGGRKYVTIQHKPSGKVLYGFRNKPLRRILDVIKYCEKMLSAYDWTAAEFEKTDLEKRYRYVLDMSNEVYARYAA